MSHRIPVGVKWFIIHQKQKDIGPKRIINKVSRRFKRKITYKTVSRVWEKYISAKATADLPRSGRPKTLTDRDERALGRAMFNTSVSLYSAQKDQTINPRGLTVRTMRRTLHRQGLYPKITTRGREISLKNRRERVLFAKEHRLWAQNDWSLVIFSDESDIFPKRTQSAITWTKKGARPSLPVEKDMKYLAVKVWGCITADGRRRLLRYKGTMDQNKYRETLEQGLLHTIPEVLDPDEGWIFMQDNATCHTARSIMKWFDENRISVLPWPAQSPDLNPIENVWAEVQGRLWKKKDKCLNVDDTWTLTREIFYNLENSYIEKLYNSMNKRVKEVISKRGMRAN